MFCILLCIPCNGSMSVSLTKRSVTIVFDSDELIRSPDDPQGSKHAVIIKTT
jgi:hypothetical protein